MNLYEIRNRIEDLEREINHWERVLCHPNYSHHHVVKYSPMQRINYKKPVMGVDDIPPVMPEAKEIYKKDIPKEIHSLKQEYIKLEEEYKERKIIEERFIISSAKELVSQLINKHELKKED